MSEDILPEIEALLRDNPGAYMCAAATVPRLVAEIKRLREVVTDENAIDWARDFHCLQTMNCNDVPIVAMAKKWHSAYRKAQNSNLIRKKQCEDKDAELAGLQKIAIDAIAEKNFRFGLDDTCIVPVDGLVPDFDFNGCAECDLSVCPYKSWWMREAAQELQLEATKEAG